MTKNDIKLQAAKFYSKINFDRYPPDQRAAAEEMAEGMCLIAAQILCGLKKRNKAPAGISEKDWNDLPALLHIANGILSEREKQAFVESVKRIIATRDRRDIEFDTLHDLQSLVRSHITQDQKGEQYAGIQG